MLGLEKDEIRTGRFFKLYELFLSPPNGRKRRYQEHNEHGGDRAHCSKRSYPCREPGNEDRQRHEPNQEMGYAEAVGRSAKRRTEDLYKRSTGSSLHGPTEPKALTAPKPSLESRPWRKQRRSLDMVSRWVTIRDVTSLLDPLTEEQTAFVEAVAEVFVEHHRWPIFDFVRRELARRGIDANQALTSFPNAGILHGGGPYSAVWTPGGGSPDRPVELTVVGMHHSELISNRIRPPIEHAFLDVLAYLIRRYEAELLNSVISLVRLLRVRFASRVTA